MNPFPAYRGRMKIEGGNPSALQNTGRNKGRRKTGIKAFKDAKYDFFLMARIVLWSQPFRGMIATAKRALSFDWTGAERL
ncbi:hypothetical protein OLZ32_35425 [Rhizobium sp. 1AS11]|uniref:hypothetical protein n=1 Tax=Rhizobium acaciae TaxID=2989736 RepID=UPI0012FA9598|nr:hypothetical protein [Rhizobium acaciae]MCW1414082.1 hypothetical protein [Rhizobium acaciae]MCW1745657.1 hypothetical protein [Rhizobium acaciae]